jgi:Kef-type K+ transport system membrane component KefB
MDDPFVSTLILILLALLGARFSFSTISIPPGPRLVFRTGTHFLFLGLALGPHVLGLLTEEAIHQLFPLLGLGLGWIGFLFGLQLEGRHLRKFPPAFFILALGQAALTFLIFLGLGWVLLTVSGQTGQVQLLLLIGAAATAAVSTPAGIALVSTNFLVKGKVRDLLFFVASLDALVGIAALQLAYSLFPPGALAVDSGLGMDLLWVLAALGLGIVCGILFLWLTRPRPGGEELVLFLLGIAAFSSGAALQLQLSPLFVSVTMGAVVANLSPEPQRIYRVLHEWEKPIYVVFLILAGALLSFPTPWVLPLALAYAIIRAAGKVLGNMAMVRIVPVPFPTPKRFGLGLLPQGGISLAMAISGVLTYSGLELGSLDAVAVLFAVVVLGVIISELTGPFFTQNILTRAGEISPRVREALQSRDSQRAHVEAMTPDPKPIEPDKGNA